MWEAYRVKNTRPTPGQLREALLNANSVAQGTDVGRPGLAAVCRVILAELAAQHPGGSLEIRVPPFAAVQAGLGGRGDHTRGTPPNVVEMSPETLCRLAVADLSWTDATAAFLVRASGIHTDISAWFDWEPHILLEPGDGLPGGQRQARIG
ncbi:MAG: sterol carrier family protein [Propionibacteriaceae bacterium]|jgi:hypothetical protein|nr:sterol carrier family protein [Propionibacteriaceae bacterium]